MTALGSTSGGKLQIPVVGVLHERLRDAVHLKACLLHIQRAAESPARTYRFPAQQRGSHIDGSRIRAGPLGQIHLNRALCGTPIYIYLHSFQQSSSAVAALIDIDRKRGRFPVSSRSFPHPDELSSCLPKREGNSWRSSSPQWKWEQRPPDRRYRQPA